MLVMVGAGVRASLISSCMLEAPPENPKPPGPSTALVRLTTPGETGPSGKKPSPTFFTDTAGGSGAFSTPCARAPSGPCALSRRTEGSYFQGPEPGSRPKETRVMGARFMRLKKEIALTLCAAAWKWESASGWRLGSRGVEGKRFGGAAGLNGGREEALGGAKRIAEEMVEVENLAMERAPLAGSFENGRK
jgi:hypothetical protein